MSLWAVFVDALYEYSQPQTIWPQGSRGSGVRLATVGVDGVRLKAIA